MILADTKFEFGFAGDELLLIDEVLTPDSSRYWPADRWTPGPGRALLRQAIRPGLARPDAAGTTALRLRRCPTRSSPAPAIVTSRPTNALPAPRFADYLGGLEPVG